MLNVVILVLLIIHYHDRIIIIVGGVKYNDDILEYDPEEDSIVPLGQMTQARYFHAISVVPTKDYSKWCNEVKVWSQQDRNLKNVSQ